MVHQPHGGVRGQVSDIEIQAAEILRMRTQLNEILAKHTGKAVEVIAKDTRSRLLFDGTSCKGLWSCRRDSDKATGTRGFLTSKELY